jgi:hypothetical protein
MSVNPYLLHYGFDFAPHCSKKEFDILDLLSRVAVGFWPVDRPATPQDGFLRKVPNPVR